MKTRKIIFILFFTLGLVVFLFVFVNFSSDLLKNKNVFTASLAQDTPEIPIVNQENQVEIIEDDPIMEEEVVSTVMTESRQDQVDDLLEKIDILQRQIADLQSVSLISGEDNSPRGINGELSSPEIALVEKMDVPMQNNIIVAPVIYNTGAGSGGSGRVDYPKILISEVQIGSEDDSKQEFVELFNPTDQDVYLSDWYLQRKTKTATDYSSFAPSRLFFGKQINARGYFLIARNESGFAAHIFVTSALTENNSLVLKNPNGEISDKLGWGEASDFEAYPTVNPLDGQSIGRRFIDENEVDTDNNSVDFEIDTPTLTAQNMAYVAPPPVIIPILAPILINRVQAEGVTVKDEFVELYNPNEINVDLTGFNLKKKTFSDKHPEGTESNLVSSGSFVGIIPAQGYFLIAPQDNDDGSKNYTGSAVPDLRYSGKTFSIASGNTVLLYDADKMLMDEYVPVADVPPPPLPEDTTSTQTVAPDTTAPQDVPPSLP